MMECVYCAVRSEYLNTIQIKCSLLNIMTTLANNVDIRLGIFYGPNEEKFF